MEYLVESHLGGHYITNADPEFIEAYCEQCGDYDRIILSWEQEKKLETLLEYFSNIKMSREQLESDKNDSLVTKEELIDCLTWAFDEDRCFICELFRNEDISLEEKILLLKQVTLVQKQQFELLKSYYYPCGYVRKREN